MRCLHDVEAHACIDTISAMAARHCNKVIIFVFFAHKKFSRSFVKLQLNPWCHMDYFTDVLATFLDLDRDSSLAVYERSERSRISYKIS